MLAVHSTGCCQASPSPPLFQGNGQSARLGRWTQQCCQRRHHRYHHPSGPLAPCDVTLRGRRHACNLAELSPAACSGCLRDLVHCQPCSSPAAGCALCLLGCFAESSPAPPHGGVFYSCLGRREGAYNPCPKWARIYRLMTESGSKAFPASRAPEV